MTSSLASSINTLLEKLRPKIVEHITQSNLFYQHYKGKVMRRFTYVGGVSNKYWEIWEPNRVGKASSEWVVRVHWGRNDVEGDGSWNTKEFGTFYEARSYYETKLNEKQAKGYVEETGEHTWQSEQSVAAYIAKKKYGKLPADVAGAVIAKTKNKKIPKVILYQEAPEPCQHKRLINQGNGKFKCPDCRSTVEIGKPPESMRPIEVEKKAKRYIDLNWRR